MSGDYFNNTNSFNITISDERSNILAWLSPLDPRLRHQDIRGRRVENVGEWVLQTEEFRSWYSGSGGSESDNAVLFCYGGPGVGKTFISSLVINQLCDLAKGGNFAVACFYFDFVARREQSPTNVLGALLKQVVSGLEEVPEEIVRAYEDQKEVIGGQGPQLASIVKILQTISSRKRTFICIDALDECAERDRVKILNSLNEILQKSPGTRIFVSGRPHIRADIEKRLDGRVTSVSISPRRGDIINYIRARLRFDTSPDAMDSSLKADILKKIPGNFSEIFLLVSLNIDAILQETTIHRRQQKLSGMTNGLGLGDAYSATLDRIKGQGGERARLGTATLMWILHSERPLKGDELRHALAVKIGSPNLDSDNVPSIGTMLACCRGLVAVDNEASTVRLIHVTLQAYLRTHPELFGAAHSTMAETCLSYLNSQQIKALSKNLSPNLQGAPFLEYSSLYWGVHAKKELSDRAKLLALRLFDDYNNHISIEFFLKAQEWCSYVGFDKRPLFSGLHCASAFGIVEIVADLVEMENCDINQEDFAGNTALVWAALNGHEGVVEMLLVRDNVNPGKPNKYVQTLLLGAARDGHAGVVKILLGRDEVIPDKPDNDGRTPLWCAAHNEHEEVVKVLLSRGDVNPDKPDNRGQTPLFGAARNGCQGVVEILLERDDVSPEKPDNRGQTPLYRAAWDGHERVVKILLGRGDVNPNKPDLYGQTPLFGAATNGRRGVVKILLGRDDVDPGKPNRYAQTPLFGAAQNGHESVVKILLGRDDINPDKPDSRGQTPLYCAAWNGHEGVVKILLSQGDVNPDKPDVYGQTPLFGAAMNGCEGVVKILLGQEDVNPSKSNKHGQTPLFGAVWDGHEGVVKILLGRDDVSPDKPDKLGRTPLWWAAKSGHAGVVALLQRQI